MKIFKTECMLNAQLPNKHICSSAVQEFCPNLLLQTHFSVVVFFPVCGLISLQQSPIEFESNKLNFMMK